MGHVYIPDVITMLSLLGSKTRYCPAQRIVITECSNAFRLNVTMLDPRHADASFAEQSHPDWGEHEAVVGEVSAWFGVGGLQLIEFTVLLYGAVAAMYGGPGGVI